MTHEILNNKYDLFKLQLDDERAHKHFYHYSDMIAQIRKLRDGWLGGEGLALNGDGLNWLHDKLRKYFLYQPTLYPTVDGNVLMEWWFQHFDCSLKIDLKDRVGYWCVIKRDDLLETYEVLDLKHPSEWDYLSYLVRYYYV